MIDVLTLTREGRLAVLELKADEDIHLPLQGLDYWARVRVASRARRVFEDSDILAGGNCRRSRRCCFWLRPRCMCIPRRT